MIHLKHNFENFMIGLERLKYEYHHISLSIFFSVTTNYIHWIGLVDEGMIVICEVVSAQYENIRA